MMKHIIAATVAALTMTTTPAVQAEQGANFAWMPNVVGGRIVLQSHQCPWAQWERGMVMYATKPGKRTSRGCWWYEDDADTVHVLYNDGNAYSYPGSWFTFFKQQ